MNSDPKSVTVHRFCSRVILGLSLFALGLVLGAAVLAKLGRFSPSADGDEGTPAHLFQLAVALLAPAGLAFILTADRSRPWRSVKQLILPAAALVMAFALLYRMEHIR